MGLLSIFGIGNGKIKEVIRKGAVIIDVRSAAEYDRGHIPRALNIPSDRINISVQRIKDFNKPVILCCNSGDRSSTAYRTLKQQGVKEVYNGGNWEKLLRTIRS